VSDRNIIEVFADIWCPFAYVGLRMIRDYRDKLGAHDTVIIVRSWPLELVNDAPMDPAKAKGNCEALREQVAPDAFSHVNVDSFPTSTLDALTLIAHAYSISEDVGEKAAFRVREALFEEGRDISDRAVLDDLAAELGVSDYYDPTYEAVRKDWEEGKRRRVIGSPHFFYGAVGTFCPSLQMTREAATGLTINTDTTRLQEFLKQCFIGA